MKKFSFLLAMVLLTGAKAFSQTTATDFTATDCDGDTYNLFSNLDNEKIVVIAWIMPCATCITDPLTAFTLVESYNSNHSNRIHFIVADDYANTNCNTLSAWTANYGIGDGTREFSDPSISMSDYGTDGMPKIVILGGTNHKVYFNKNSSTEGFEAALNLALSENPLSIDENPQSFKLNVYPNPANETLNIFYEISEAANIQLDLFNIQGSIVSRVQPEGIKENGIYNLKIDLTEFGEGTYFLRMSSNSTVKMVKIIVTH